MDRRLAEGVHLVRLNLDDQAHFARLTIRIHVLVEVLLRHLVDVRVGALVGDADHPSLNRHVAVRVVGIRNRQRDARIALEVVRLHAPLRRVHDEVGAVGIDPHGRHLWTAIGIERRQVGERLLLQQIEMCLRDAGHRCLQTPHPNPTTRKRASWILCRRLIAMATAVRCSIDSARARGPRSTARSPGSSCTSADAWARASSESPHTNSSQSSGRSTSASRCAGIVLNAPASRTWAGSRALTYWAADPSATLTIDIFPPSNVTGTVTWTTS